MKNKLSPIVLFTYNRPWHTRQTGVIKKSFCTRKQLFIYSDAQKKQSG